MARQDQNDAVLQHVVSLRRQCRLYRRPARPLSRTTRSRSTPNGGDFFGGLKDDAGGRRKNAARRRPGSGRTGRSAPMANWSRRSTATGARSRSTSATSSRPRPPADGARRRRRRRCPAGDARFGPRHHDDPRLPHARPSARQSRSARPRSRRRPRRAATRRPTASPRPTSTARSSSTTCSGLEYATIREMLDILQRTYCCDARRRVHAHLRSGGEGLDPGAHRRAGQGASPSPARARRRSSTS